MVYPRITGHCACHNIPTSVAIPEDNGSLILRVDMDKALRYLQSIKADLVRGDLIIFDSIVQYHNEGIAIFNGREIINLCYDENVDRNGHLPQEFRVIEGGVPIDYWEDRQFICDNPVRGIECNSHIWFDHKVVLAECIENIQYGCIETGEYCIFTTFMYNKPNEVDLSHIRDTKVSQMYNNQEYRIIFDYADTFYAHLAPESLEIKSSILLHKLKDTFITLLLAALLPDAKDASLYNKYQLAGIYLCN